MNNRLVSVIIPVFNIRDYVGHCIKSVINQTYKELEIIVVDDGSTDGSSELCDSLAEKDNRIKVIHQPNSGVSAARNTGLENVSGDYVMFIDGDDIISPEAIEVLIKDITRNRCILSGFSYLYIDSYVHSFPKAGKEIKASDSKEVVKGILEGTFIFISACFKLYPTDLVKKMRFVEGRGANEDKFFLFQYLMRNEGVVTQRPDELYGYYMRPGSATKSPYSERMLDVIYFSDRIIKEVKSSREELTESAEYNDVVTCLSVLKSIIRSGVYRKEKATFSKVKRRVLKYYNAKNLGFFKKYKTEIIALKISDYLYIMCVYLFDFIKKVRR